MCVRVIPDGVMLKEHLQKVTFLPARIHKKEGSHETYCYVEHAHLSAGYAWRQEHGGMNVYVRELSRELGRRGYDVDVFTRCENPSRPHIIQLGPHARVIHICAGPADHQDKNQLFAYLPEFVAGVLGFAEAEGFRYDLIHSHYWLSGWVAHELQRVWTVPIVQMFHTLGHMKNRVAQAHELREQGRRIEVEGELMRWADRIVAATERDQAQMVTLYGADPSKMRIIPPPSARPSSRNGVCRK